MQAHCRLAWLPAFLAVVLSGCFRSSDRSAGTSEASEDGAITVYVVNYPLEYFARRIGGDHVKVVLPTPANADPAFWMPDAESITAYQQADLILLNGASHAKWTKTVSLPETKLVDTTSSVTDQYIKVENSVTHTHGPGGEHAHAETAFTTWLDPRLALVQAETIRQAFARLWPGLEEDFDRNFAALSHDLRGLDEELAAIVEGTSRRPVLFSHPVYQYLRRRYDLNAKSVHWEPAEIPSQNMWDELAGMLEQHPAKWMLWESEPIEETVKRLAALGVQSTVFDPCARRPAEGDFLEVMHRNVANLGRALADETR